MMKTFKQYLESNLKNNPAIPGQGDKREGERDYLSDVKRKESDKVGHPGMIIGELMSKVNSVSRYIRGNEEKLEKVAYDVISDLYSDIFKRYNIKLDIKIVQPGFFRTFMNENKQNEIYKRKISNLLMQGEAKNTKFILHSPQVKAGLMEIYNDENLVDELIKTWSDISKLADKMDHSIPIEQRKHQIEHMDMAAHQAGGVRVKFPKKNENDNDDTEVVTIEARGIDFPMLLHESVKGIYEVLMLGGIPEDRELAKIALDANPLSDEPEDFVYGPSIASDIRDFINENEKVSLYKNVKEEFYKLIVDKEYMSTPDFLELIRGILSKTIEARVKVDRIIDEVIEYIEDLERYEREMEEYNKKMEEYNKKMAEFDKSKSISDEDISEPEEEKPFDYSKLSKSELNDMINLALDEEDYLKVKELSKFLDSYSYKKIKRKING